MRSFSWSDNWSSSFLDSRLHVDPIAKGSATGYFFPSGHTTTATANFLGIGLRQRKKVWVPVLMVFLTLLVAFSRNWLGVWIFIFGVVFSIVMLIGTVTSWFLEGRIRTLQKHSAVLPRERQT